MDVDDSETTKFNGINGDSRRLGVLYDERMCKHHTPDGDYHPENPYRIRAIWNKLHAAGILQRYDRFCFFISVFFFSFLFCSFCMLWQCYEGNGKRKSEELGYTLLKWSSVPYHTYLLVGKLQFSEIVHWNGQLYCYWPLARSCSLIVWK